MKTFYKLATLTLLMAVLAVSAFAQEQAPELAIPAVTPLVNLTEGQGTIASGSGPSWDGLSEFVLIPGRR